MPTFSSEMHFVRGVMHGVKRILCIHQSVTLVTKPKSCMILLTCAFHPYVLASLQASSSAREIDRPIGTNRNSIGRTHHLPDFGRTRLSSSRFGHTFFVVNFAPRTLVQCRAPPRGRSRHLPSNARLVHVPSDGIQRLPAPDEIRSQESQDIGPISSIVGGVVASPSS